MKKITTIIIIALMIIPSVAAANNIWWWFSSTEYAMFNGTSKEITGLNISCNNIIGSPDTDFCTDATGGGGTGKSGDGLYLYNDTTIMYFNETLLNSTIDARDTDTTYTNTSPISLSGTTFGLSVCSDTQILKMSGSDWVCSADATGAGGDKSGDGLYLYNDTTVIYFNETLLNSTIDARDTDTTIGNCSVDGSCGLITYDSELSYIGNCSGANCNIGWGNLTGVPAGLADGDDDTYNTTQQMIDAVNGTALNGVSFFDILLSNIQSFSESDLESQLSDVTDVFTNNDGALNDDNVTLADVQAATSSDFHNIGGTDDDVPESGDFGNAAELDSTGAVSCSGCLAIGSEVTDTGGLADGDDDTQLTEDQVEAYIFDTDNAVDLNMTEYSITNVKNLTFGGDAIKYIIDYNSTCFRFKGNTAEIHLY